MKKRKNPHKIDCVTQTNPVAKFARQFNKAHVFADKNSYRRNAKHRKQDVSLMILARIIRETSCLLELLHLTRSKTALAVFSPTAKAVGLQVALF